MNHEAAISLVYTLLLGEQAIPVRIRSRQPVAHAEVQALFSAIDGLIAAYADQDHVPKKLALAFVDIYGAFSFAPGFFDEQESRRYEDIGIALQEKACELFGE